MSGGPEDGRLIPYKGYSDTEYRVLLPRLWALLGKQSAKYTMGDSSSVTAETAQELLASLWYTLTLAVEETGIDYGRLLTDELYPLVKLGQGLLRRKTKLAKRMWSLACQTAPDIRNVFYKGTLKGIGDFFARYDIYYFAHRRPADIDYPLIRQPSEELQGVSYAEEYLRSLLTENLLLSKLDGALVRSLLKNTASDYGETFLNLCEQPLINALGRALLGKSVLPLNIDADDRARLLELFRGKDRARLRSLLSETALSVCDELGIRDAFTRAYVSEPAHALAPRLAATAETGDISKIFITMAL